MMASEIPNRIARMPRVGGAVDLLHDDGSEPTGLVIRHVYGAAVLYGVETASGATGVLAVQPDGTWWWVKTPEEKEPWQR